MLSQITFKDVVHHGVEAIAFAAVGSWAVASPMSACAAYAIGKVTYLGTKKILEYVQPEMSIDYRRKIAWGTCLLTGGFTLHTAVEKITGVSMNALTSAGTTLGITGASIGIRVLADKVVTYVSAPKPTVEQQHIE